MFHSKTGLNQLNFYFACLWTEFCKIDDICTVDTHNGDKILVSFLRIQPKATKFFSQIMKKCSVSLVPLFIMDSHELLQMNATFLDSLVSMTGNIASEHIN